MVVADESKTTTIAALINQKDVLLQEIREMQEVLSYHTAILIKVSDTGIFKNKMQVQKRAVFLTPLLLICLFSFVYLIIYLYKKMIDFVNQ